MPKNTFAHISLERIFNRLSSHTYGLSSREVREKQMTFGKNILPEKKKNWGKMLLSEFTSPLVLILFGAVAISITTSFLENGEISGHNLIEPIAIIIILLFNALLGFYQELKAEKTLEALKTLQPEESIVLRNKEKIKVSASDIVRGDIIFLSEGEKVPADIRLLESVECTVNESLLTGESLPVLKTVDGKVGDSPADTKNMVFSGSEIISGRAKGIVSATGKETEIGKIAGLLSSTTSPPTPLEKNLDTLGKRIGIAIIVICGIVFGLSFLKGIPLIDSLLTSVALAVGAVPEGLPAVMTVSLAIGVSIMARKNMLIRELKSVETLGSVTVIASDKTGTITQNKMSVEEIFLNNPKNKEEMQLFFEVLKNCNDAKLPNIGDPTEIGLLQKAEEKNAQSYERISEIPFSSSTKWMSTTHKISGKTYEFIKGAPEVISKFCEKSTHQKILNESNRLAKKGMRCIGVAIREIPENFSGEHSEISAKFLGIAGLQDPPRKNVKKAISDVKNAGVRTIMITGDHAVTAQSIAQKVGITGEVIQGFELEKLSDTQLKEKVQNISIYARVSPEHKVRICKALQKNGEIVAMTGDGVNDAPALSQAEVGISMGKVGTSVARSASDIVLLDDDFSTIVKGIEEGRRIFSNIKKSVVFLLSTNFAEVLVLFIALLINLPLPLLPLHILLINLFTDSFPALALAKEPSENDVMKRKPRPISEGFLHGEIFKIISIGSIITIFTLWLFAYGLSKNISLSSAQTLAFVSLSIGELLVIFSLRTQDSIFSNTYFQRINFWVVGASLGGICITILLVISPLQKVLFLENFDKIFWIYMIIGTFISLILAEVIKKMKISKNTCFNL